MQVPGWARELRTLPLSMLGLIGSGATPVLVAAQSGTGPSSPVAPEFAGGAAASPWLLIAGMLVMVTHGGVACLEAGFTRSKNVVNILMKNLVGQALASLVFWAVGFALMFGESNGVFGFSHFAIGAFGGAAPFSFVFFQMMLCAVATTIVSGAMAERTRFATYAVTSVGVAILIYPVFGSWAWGASFAGRGLLEAPVGGLLQQLGLPAFVDLAGSTVVHSVGGWVALAGTMALGPRIGKFSATGGVQPLLGHNMAIATLGMLLLWFGWFGFSLGSAAMVTGQSGASWAGLAMVLVNTHLAACAALLMAMLLATLTVGKCDIGLALNGALGGLVAISAACSSTTPAAAVVIGAVAGVVVVAGVRFLDRVQVDDPVGAVSVHGFCGVWGTLAVAVFYPTGFSLPRLGVQLLGAGIAFVWAFGCGFLLFSAVQRVLGLRVSEQDELDGLDLSEHGAEAYPEERGRTSWVSGLERGRTGSLSSSLSNRTRSISRERR